MSNTDAACLIAVITAALGQKKLSPAVDEDWQRLQKKFRAGVSAIDSNGGTEDADD